MKGKFLIFAAAVILAGCASVSLPVGNTDAAGILFREDFSDGTMDGWWVEGGEKVWVQDGRLYVTADPAKVNSPAESCTVWYNQMFCGDVEITFDAHVVSSRINANNINFFFHYTCPAEGRTIWNTREERADATYKKYHNLNGYIVTFLNDFNKEAPLYGDGTAKARLRLRRCPGFKLITECYDYHCQAGITYHCKIVKKGSHIEFFVDGKQLLEATDEQFLDEGYIGLRTYRTCLWWDNIIVRNINK